MDAFFAYMLDFLSVLVVGDLSVGGGESFSKTKAEWESGGTLNPLSSFIQPEAIYAADSDWG